MARPGPAAALVVVNVVLLLVLLGIVELGLAWYDDTPPSVQYSVFPPNVRISVAVNPRVTPGVRDDAQFDVNELGTRGLLPSPADDLRIVAIGGSTTECFVLSLEESWPFRVGELLEASTKKKVWVANIARSGRNSRQHYFDAKYVVPQFGRVDVALLMVGINDQFNRMIQGQSFQTVDVVTLDDDGEYVFRALEVAERDGGWLARRHLAVRLRHALESLAIASPRRQEIRSLLNHTLPRFYVDGRRMRAARHATITTLPPMKAPIREFERNLGLIVRLLRENGTEPVFITQASMWRGDLTESESRLLWLGSADGWPPNRDGGPYYSVGAMASMLEMYNDALRRVARTTGTELIDVTGKVPGDTTTFYDDVHFNEGGAERIAKIVPSALMSSEMLP